MTVDGVTTNTTMSADGLDLTVGNRYLVKATLNNYGLATIIKTTDWDSQTAWKEDVSFVPIIPPIDIGLPFVIASGNLIATKQADGAYKYAFDDEQGYYSGVNDAAYDVTGGDYFCWNTLSPSDLNITQPEWQDERDPCRQIGDGKWHTLTNDEWDKFRELNTAGKSIWGTYTMEDGSGTKYGNDDSAGTISYEGFGLFFRSSYVTDGTSDDFRYLGFSLRHAAINRKSVSPVNLHTCM